MDSLKGFSEHFARLTSGNAPHPWQRELASRNHCDSRLIRIPTGFGKTLGVLAAWTYHRVLLADDRWPRRLVWCLPMRVLVEQTEREAREGLNRLGLLWEDGEDRADKIGVHALMGGADSGDWQLYPEHCAVLIGTQDMLLSRALNRGYGAARARWPMDFGLLSQDCLWVMDEVQLMDVGLATSGQLQSFRRDDQNSNRMLRPCSTWWMSATLQRSWLQKSPDTSAMASELQQLSVRPENRSGRLWDGVHKPVRIASIEGAGEIAQLASQAHIEGGRGSDGPTLVVLNRVQDAISVFEALKRDKSIGDTELHLAHSRFRRHERVAWHESFLNRSACAPPRADRIIVATQVIEAGVDISAARMITQIAPWPSLVQRFGRAARWGGTAHIIVADSRPEDAKAAAPYVKESIDGARDALSRLADVSPLSLEAFEDANPSLLPSLYPYAPCHLLLRHELHDLFDTTPDLSGADIDISRFIRSGDERDLQVFWQDIAEDAAPDRTIKPARDALCAVPVFKAREWLCAEKSERLRPHMRAWTWDYLKGSWCRAERRNLYAGQIVLVAADCGGYHPLTGWSPKSRDPVSIVPCVGIPPEEQTDASEDDESLSAGPSWQTIAFHGREVAREIAQMTVLLHGDLRKCIDIACRWHDVGKVHEAFGNSIQHPEKPDRNDLAKARVDAWVPFWQLYRDNTGRRRGGFRHELASTLALFDVLRRHNPNHPALVGPWRELLQLTGSVRPLDRRGREAPNVLEQEILDLTADEFDLVAYLVCCHHGKIRLTWHASPADQGADDSVLRIRGIRDGECLAPVLVATSAGEFVKLPESKLCLDASAVGLSSTFGRSWSERTLNLLSRRGPFALAYLEALLRAADWRASRDAAVDPLLQAPQPTARPNVGERSYEQGAA